MSEPVRMQNPYIAFAESMTSAVLGGGRVQLSGGDSADLPRRLRLLARYCTENQKNAADALLVLDLHAAADALERHARAALAEQESQP